MQVILCEDVTGLGIIGDIVRVKPGYARNYLLPRGLAVVADSRNLKRLEHEKRVIAAKRARERGTVERVAEAMEGLVLETESRAGRGGKLFGSVTNMDIARLLAEKNFEIDRRRIDVKEPIKAIGTYEVTVRVGQDITATVKVVVNPLGGELEAGSVDGDDHSHDGEDAVAAPDESTAAESAESAEPADTDAAAGADVTPAAEEARSDDEAKGE